MNKHWLHRIYPMMFALFLVSTQAIFAAENASPPDHAVAFVHLLVKQDYSAACEHFGAEVKQALPCDKFEAAWLRATDKLGAFKTTGETKTAPVQDYTVVVVESIFEHGALWVQVAYDRSGMIAGIHFLPTD